MFASEVDNLSNSQEWKSLLHINENNQSEITDLSFFLSNQTNSKIEIETLLNNQSCDNICKYPARYRLLSKTFDLNISFEHCEELQSFLKETRGPSASLVFASSFLGSPASYFGHTFMLINKKDNPFFSSTLGYAAELPKSGNPMDIIVKGVSGQYSGKYVLASYYQMAELYNVVEQRTLYQYKLDLTEEEIENMLWHMYEIKNINVPYKFFTENCAYEVFWLIEAARPTAKLRDKLKPYVIPFETVQVLKDEHMIIDHKTKEPMIEHLYQIYTSLTSKEKEQFFTLIESQNKEKKLSEMDLSDSVHNKLIELINGYYDILFKKYHVSKVDYYDVKKIKFKKEAFDDTIDFEPRKPHRISFGGISRDGKIGNSIGFRPVLFDKLEERDSLISEGTLEFLNINMSRVSNHTRIDNFDLIKVESLNKRFDFYEPMSWRVYIGANRSYQDSVLSPVLEFGSGITKGNEMISAYGLLQMALYPTEKSANLQALVGVSLWIQKGHLNFDYKDSFADYNGASRTNKLISFFYPLTKSFSLRALNDFSLKEKSLYIDYKF